MSNGNNEEEMTQASNDNEGNQTAANIRQEIPLAEPVRDERTIDPQQLTNEQINTINVHQPDHHEATRQAIDWLIFLLYGFLVYQLWPLFTFVCIAYPLLTYDNQSAVTSDVFDPNRDAQAEGRTGHPTEQDITFSNTIEILDHVPFGTPDTQAHDTAVLVGLNNMQHTNVITNNENGNINTNGIITRNILTEANLPITTDEHNEPQTAVDNPTCNINPFRSVQPQNDHHSSDSSDGEDPIVSSESTFDGDNEDDSADDKKRTAVEIEANVAALVDGAQQVIIPRIRTRDILIPKSRNLVRPDS